MKLESLVVVIRLRNENIKMSHLVLIPKSKKTLATKAPRHQKGTKFEFFYRSSVNLCTLRASVVINEIYSFILLEAGFR